MTDLFDQKLAQELAREAPLSDRMRPRTFDEFVGQEEIIGETRVLRKAIENDELFSMILWGPPGTGKTTLARIVAAQTKSRFVQISAVTSGIGELRQLVREAGDARKFHGQRTVLFVDEIHRWNKAQQDSLLPHVENGTIVLIGATTENPSFEVISALLSRTRVYTLQRLASDHIGKIIKRSLQDSERGLGSYQVKIGKDALELIIRSSNGDARSALNTIEIAVKATKADAKGVRHVHKTSVEEALQHAALRYDKGGEEHYNIISAFIKSLRGSSPDGALYWLARMLEAGEDARFIARRMVILASEDIGIADPQALVVANAAAQAVEFVGLPEAQLNLAEAAVYLALAPKSNAVYKGLLAAKADAKDALNAPVPLHLRNAVTDLMGELGYGKDYKYSHDYSLEDGKQEYLPEELKGKKYFTPPDDKA